MPAERLAISSRVPSLSRHSYLRRWQSDRLVDESR
jgi:hypothetical protein